MQRLRGKTLQSCVIFFFQIVGTSYSGVCYKMNVRLNMPCRVVFTSYVFLNFSGDPELSRERSLSSRYASTFMQ
jgi:hypothetical protein